MDPHFGSRLEENAREGSRKNGGRLPQNLRVLGHDRFAHEAFRKTQQTAVTTVTPNFGSSDPPRSRKLRLEKLGTILGTCSESSLKQIHERDNWDNTLRFGSGPCFGTYPSGSHDYECPLVIKHGNFENSPIIDIFPARNLHFGGLPS